MCEQMASEPVENEIPIEFHDLPLDIQTVLDVYSLLPNEWNPETGFYLGKNLNLLPYLFKLHDIDDEKHSLNIIIIADQINKDIINTKQEAKLKKAAKKNGKSNY